MRIQILRVGKARGSKWAELAIDDYGKRLRRWERLDDAVVRPETFRGDVDAVRAAESERLLGRLAPRDVVIALDERGTALDTHAFTGVLRHARDHGTHRVVFLIGGAYGHAPALRSRADHVVRLSTLVLNHELARVTLYEQLYRAYTLIQGVPYHH